MKKILKKEIKREEHLSIMENKEAYMQSLGEFLKDLRIKNNITYYRILKDTDIKSILSIKALEKGDKTAHLPIFIILLEYYGINILDIIRKTEK